MALRENPQAEGPLDPQHSNCEKSQSQGNYGRGYLAGFPGPPQPQNPDRREGAHLGYCVSWGVADELVPGWGGAVKSTLASVLSSIGRAALSKSLNLLGSVSLTVKWDSNPSPS